MAYVPAEGPAPRGSAGLVGFDPHRLAAVAVALRDAVEALRGVTSLDPMASDAAASIGSIRFELETTWLPAIARVLAATAMSGWDTADPSGSPTTSPTTSGGPPSGHPLTGTRSTGTHAVFVDEVGGLLARIADGDLWAVDELRAVLVGHADDTDALAALLSALGTDGWWDAIMILGGCTSELDAADALASVDVLLGALAHAPDDGTFGAESFGRTLVSRLTDASAVVESDVRADPYSVAVAVLGSAALPDEFEVAAAIAGGRFLSDGGPGPGHTNNNGWFLGGTPAGCLAIDLSTRAELVDDPFGFLVRTVSDDPAQARALLGDDDVVEWVFAHHPWADGFETMFGLLEVAVAGPDLTDRGTPPRDEDVHAANVIVTRAVAYLADRPGFDPDAVSDAASVSASNVTAAHLIALEVAVNTPFESADGSAGDGGVVSSPALDDEFLRSPVLPRVEHVSMPPGHRVETALFELDGAALLVGAAGSTESGIAGLRAGTAQFYAHCAAGAAVRIERYTDAESFPGFDAGATYSSAATWNAGTEGFIIQSIFGPDELAAAARDRRTQLWVSTLSGMVGKAAGELEQLSPFTVAIGPVATWIADRIATEQSAVVDEATSFARRSVAGIADVYTSAARQHGLDLGGAAASPPNLPPLGDAVVAVTDAVVYQPGDRVTLDIGVIRDRLITAQTAEYVPVATGRLR